MNTSLCDAPEPPVQRHPDTLRQHLALMHATLRLFKAVMAVTLTLPWKERSRAEQRKLLRIVRDFRQRLLEPQGYQTAEGARAVNSVRFAMDEGYVFPHLRSKEGTGAGKYPATIVGCELRTDGTVDLVIGALYPATTGEAEQLIQMLRDVPAPPDQPLEECGEHYFLQKVGIDNFRGMSINRAIGHLQRGGPPEKVFEKLLAEYHLDDPRVSDVSADLQTEEMP